MASIFELRFKNINSDAILFIKNFRTMAVNTGIDLRIKSVHILGGKNKRIDRMTKPITNTKI